MQRCSGKTNLYNRVLLPTCIYFQQGIMKTEISDLQGGRGCGQVPHHTKKNKIGSLSSSTCYEAENLHLCFVYHNCVQICDMIDSSGTIHSRTMNWHVYLPITIFAAAKDVFQHKTGCLLSLSGMYWNIFLDRSNRTNSR